MGGGAFEFSVEPLFSGLVWIFEPSYPRARRIEERRRHVTPQSERALNVMTIGMLHIGDCLFPPRQRELRVQHRVRETLLGARSEVLRQ